MEEIRLGTIGSGNIVHWVLDGVMLTEGIRLEAVYSRNMEKGKKLAQQYGAGKVYTDMDTFLADENVNFVYIATPNILHYEQAKRALEAGKNVMLEKPFCPRLDQARELVELARAKKLILIDAVPTIFLPNLRILQEKLGEVGKLRLVMGNFSQYSSRYDQLLAGEMTNVFNPDFAGGCLMDINFYNVYLNVLLFGKPQKAVYTPNLYEGKIDTSGILTMRYPDFASTAVGAKDTWGVNYFQIEGEKGFIYADGGSVALTSIRVVTKNADETFNVQTNPTRWVDEVQYMTRHLLDGDYAFFDRGLDVMLDVIETIENARKDAGIFFPCDL